MNNDEEEDFTDQYVPTKEIIDDNTLHLSYCLIKRQWLKEDRLTAATVPALQQSFPRKLISSLLRKQSHTAYESQSFRFTYHQFNLRNHTFELQTKTYGLHDPIPRFKISKKHKCEKRRSISSYTYGTEI